MFGTFESLRRIEQMMSQLVYSQEKTMALIDDLRAAVQADADADAKLMAHLADLKAKLDDATARLDAALAAPAISAEEVQAVIDSLRSHAADVEAHIPAVGGA